MTRNDLRKKIRSARQSMSTELQKSAALNIKMNISQHLQKHSHTRVAVYLSNDGELDTSLIIKQLWKDGKQVYLPIIHPFCHGYLLFQRYEKNSPMSVNRYGILEPKLNCSQVCPIEELDVLFTPLVAFDTKGNRLGMGGGYYDRSLAKVYREKRTKPMIIGLAHQSQQVDSLPVESWDIPLKTIITPKRCYQW